MAEDNNVRQQHIDVVKRLFNEVYTQGNMEVIDELVSEDVVNDIEAPGIPQGMLPQGREAFKELGLQMKESMPDLQFHIMDGFPLAVDDNQVANWWTGEIPGENPLPEDGPRLRMSEIYHFNAEGKIARIVYQGNAMEFFSYMRMGGHRDLADDEGLDEGDNFDPFGAPDRRIERDGEREF